MSAQQKQLGLRVVVIALVVAVLIFGGIGITGAAAQASIPGDALYSVKTTIEQTRLSLAQDAGNRAQMKMAFAQERLNEIDALIKDGRFPEVGPAVLAFEANINSAIAELEILAKANPARASQLALEITGALSRYAQTLSDLVARVPESVKSEVNRALDTTRVVGGMDMPTDDDDSNSNSNSNDNDDDENSNSNSNSNDADSNSNSNDDNSNSNSYDDNSNSNTNDDNSNSNSNDDDGYDDDDDNSNSNLNSNDNSDDNANMNDDNSNSNVNDDSSNSNDDGSGSNSNSNDDDSNSNSNDDDSNSNSNDDDSNSNSNDDNSNSNGNDDD